MFKTAQTLDSRSATLDGPSTCPEPLVKILRSAVPANDHDTPRPNAQALIETLVAAGG